MPPYVPDELVDAAVAESLRPWLTPFERRSLAEASQSAAAAPTATAVAWRATDGAGDPSAAGSVTPVRDVFRSVHGRLCRDLRQSVAKGGPEPHLQQVTLCREDQGAGLYVWVLGKPD
jgi:surface antigen